MDDLPQYLRPVEFDHDAAFRARWAIDELIRRVEEAADHRSQVARAIFCSCAGPFVDHLWREIDGAALEAGAVADGLRLFRAHLDDVAEAAFLEDVRRQVARADWQAETDLTRAVRERAGAALAAVGSPVSPVGEARAGIG